MHGYGQLDEAAGSSVVAVIQLVMHSRYDCKVVPDNLAKLAEEQTGSLIDGERCLHINFIFIFIILRHLCLYFLYEIINSWMVS